MCIFCGPRCICSACTLRRSCYQSVPCKRAVSMGTKPKCFGCLWNTYVRGSKLPWLYIESARACLILIRKGYNRPVFAVMCYGCKGAGAVRGRPHLRRHPAQQEDAGLAHHARGALSWRPSWRCRPRTPASCASSRPCGSRCGRLPGPWSVVASVTSGEHHQACAVPELIMLVP